MQGRDHGDVPDEVSFINTQLSGRYGLGFLELSLELSSSIIVE